MFNKKRNEHFDVFYLVSYFCLTTVTQFYSIVMIYLKIKDVKEERDYKNKKKFVSDEDEASFYSNIIFDEVISKITEFIKKSIDTPECDKILDKDIFKDNDLEDLKKLNIDYMCLSQEILTWKSH